MERRPGHAVLREGNGDVQYARRSGREFTVATKVLNEFGFKRRI